MFKLPSCSSTTITRVESTGITSICFLWSRLGWTSTCQDGGIREQQSMDLSVYTCTCSVTCAVHLIRRYLVPDMSVQTFLDHSNNLLPEVESLYK